MATDNPTTHNPRERSLCAYQWREYSEYTLFLGLPLLQDSWGVGPLSAQADILKV